MLTVHVGAGVHEHAVEVVTGRGDVAGLQTALALSVGRDEARTMRVVAGGALGGLVVLRLGGFSFVGLEEGTRRDGSRATLKLAEGTHAVVEELEGLNELVRGDLGESVAGDEEGGCSTGRASAPSRGRAACGVGWYS